MKIEVNENSVVVSWMGTTKICDFDELVAQFKEADEFGRKRLAINHFNGEVFKTLHTDEPKVKSLSSLDVLEGCVHVRKRMSDPDMEREIDDLLGADPYMPLY